MKKQIINFYFLIIAVLLSTNLFAQDKIASEPSLFTTTKLNMNNKKEIEKTLKKYLKAGDDNDVQALEDVTHANFRIVLNDKKEADIKIVDRATYIDLIAKKVFGGTPRKVEIQLLDIFGNTNATVKTKLTSGEVTFYNYYSLLKVDGKWWVVQDLLYVEGM